MKKPNRRRCLIPGLLLLSALWCLAAACESDTTVSIVDSQNPPTFRLYGNGSLVLFIVVGPYSSLEDIDSGRGGDVVWEISPGEHAGERVFRLPRIKYGVVPTGFRQKTPAAGTPPPPLEEGKFYSIGTPSAGANFRVLCFRVAGGRVLKAQCRER